MQTLVQRCRTVQPFSAGVQRKAVHVARQPRRQFSPSQRPYFATRASLEGLDLSELADEVDVSAGASAMAPLATDNVRLRIRMRGYDINLLADAIADLMVIGDITGAQIKGPVMLPTRKKIYCILKSPHVNKDAREHLEIRTHHRLVDFKNLSSQTVEALMQWVPPAGVEVESSICTNATGGNQLRRLQAKKAEKAAAAAAESA